MDSLNMISLFQLFKAYEKEIYLSTNQNSEFEDLNAIWICIPKISVLPKEIGLLENLVSLELSGCGLTDVPKEIGNLKNLTHLDLSDNQLTILPKDIKKLHE